MTRLLSVALLSALATTGCLTGGVLSEVRRPSVHYRTITGVTGAAVDGDRVIIGLQVRWPDRDRLENLDVEIPMRDLEWARKNAADGRPQVPGLVFARPPAKAIRKSSAARMKATTLDVTEVYLKGPGDLATLGTGLAPGIHVLALQNFNEPGHPSHTIPAFLDTREGQEPFGVVIADLPDARTHLGFLVLLLPVTVPIDAVTLPIQLIVGLLWGGC